MFLQGHKGGIATNVVHLGKCRTLATFGAALAVSGASWAQTNYSNVVVNTRNYSGGPGFSIPDNNNIGVTSRILVSDSESVIAVNSVTVNSLTHTWAGDLTATIDHGTGSTTLFAQPGGPNESSDFNGNYTFINGGANLASTLAGLGAAAAGAFG